MTSASASDRVRAEWRNRIEAEYRSASITQHLTLWLIQVGLSPDLIRDGLRITDDELVHAEMSHAVYVDAGGDDPPRIDRDQLGLARHGEQPLELDVLGWGVQVFCLGETVAVPLFKHLRERCTVDSARECLDRVLVDEVRHRQFGWDLLDNMLELPDADQMRAFVEGALPRMFAGLEHSYGEANPGYVPNADVTDEDRSWGLAPASEYAGILHRTFERDYLPRFTERGIDPTAAWERRTEFVRA